MDLKTGMLFRATNRLSHTRETHEYEFYGITISNNTKKVSITLYNRTLKSLVMVDSDWFCYHKIELGVGGEWYVEPWRGFWR